MTMSEALRQLDELPYHWTIGKGRARHDEPLWAVALYRVSDDGVAVTDVAMFSIEGDSLDYCVNRIVAWHEAAATGA